MEKINDIYSLIEENTTNIKLKIEKNINSVCIDGKLLVKINSKRCRMKSIFGKIKYFIVMDTIKSKKIIPISMMNPVTQGENTILIDIHQYFKINGKFFKNPTIGIDLLYLYDENSEDILNNCCEWNVRFLINDNDEKKENINNHNILYYGMDNYNSNKIRIPLDGIKNKFMISGNIGLMIRSNTDKKSCGCFMKINYYINENCKKERLISQYIPFLEKSPMAYLNIPISEFMDIGNENYNESLLIEIEYVNDKNNNDIIYINNNINYVLIVCN